MYADDAGKYLTHLIGCSLHDQTPVEPPESLAWVEIFKQARRHSVENMALQSVKKLQHKPEGRVYDVWQELSHKS